MSDYKISVKIAGDSTRFQQAVSKANAAVDAFEKKTGGITSKIGTLGKSFDHLGSSLTSKITVPALSAAASLTGITLVKGFNRLKGIDSAKAKLKGLGHSAEDVTEIMNSALQSVKGTSYGMDEAATTAASAVAAGIKPGKELTRYLSLTADAAAIAGSSMSDMGSIINKVQTNQKAYSDNLNQLADRGIPIYQWIADEAGVTADAVKDMAKDGEISSEMFLKAIEKNIGGAAKTVGMDSLSGMMENVGASVSRIGANFLGANDDATGFFATVKARVPELFTYLDTVENKASKLGEQFGKTFNDVLSKVDELKSRFSQLSPEMQTAVKNAVGVGSAFTVGLGPGLKATGKVMQTVSSVTGTLHSAFLKTNLSIAGTAGKFKDIKSKVSALIGDFKNLGSGILQPISPLLSKVSGSVKNTFSTIGTSIATPFKKGFSAVSSSLGTLVGNIGTKFPKLTGIIASFETNSKGMFSAIGGSLSSILGKVGSFAPMFMKGFAITAGVGAVIAGLGLLQSGFGDKIDGVLQMVTEKGPEIITNLCNGITSKLPNLLLQGATLLNNLLTAITANLPAILNGGVAIVCSLVEGVARQLPTLIPTAVDLISTIINSLVGNIGQIIDTGLILLLALVDGVIAAIPNLIAAVPKLITSLVTGIGSKLPTIIKTGITLLVSLTTGLIKAIPQLIASIPAIIAAIKTSFTEIDWGEIGHNIIDGIKNGLSDTVSTLVQAAKDAAGAALDAIKSLLGIHSPSRVMRDQVGKMMSLGLGIGFEKNLPVKSMVGSVANAVDSIAVNAIDISAYTNGENMAPVSAYMTEDISLRYAKSVGTMRESSSQFIDTDSMGEYLVYAISQQGAMQAQAIEKGISAIKLTYNGREVARMNSSLGFSRG